MRTINSEIDIYKSETSALKAFNNSKASCHLLKSIYGDFFIDRSKTAIIEWPNHYRVLAEK